MFHRKKTIKGFVIDDEDESVYIDTTHRTRVHEFIPKSAVAKITCVFFVFIGSIPMEVGRYSVMAYKRDFFFKKHKYIVNGMKVCQIKPWHYPFTRNYFNFCFYRIGNAEPLSVWKPSFSVDADSLDRVTNDQNIKSLLPSPNKMLYMITLVALIIGGAGMAFAGYLLADPEGSENIRNLVTNQRPPPPPGIPSQGTTTPPPPVIVPQTNNNPPPVTNVPDRAGEEPPDVVRVRPGNQGGDAEASTNGHPVFLPDIIITK